MEVATEGWVVMTDGSDVITDGWEVIIDGMPVTAPFEVVNEVRDVIGFETDNEVEVEEAAAAGPVGACG